MVILSTRKDACTWTIMILSCTATLSRAWSRNLIRRNDIGCLRQVASALSSSTTSPPSNGRSMLLAKAKETFKLADLQWLEVYLQSKVRKDQDYKCDRLLVDGATGSSLFHLEVSASSELLQILQSGGITQENLESPERLKIPSGLRRCDWVAEVLCQETSAEQLVDKLLSSSHLVFPQRMDGWTLEYVRMDAVGRPSKEVGYNLKTLLCSVSQHIGGRAALNPTLARHRLILVETTDHGMFLARVFPQLFQLYGEKRKTPLFRVWSRRPFKFSSAINPMVAEMVMDLLMELVLQHRHLPMQSARSATHIAGTIHTSNQPPLRLLDPTCGSGTLLAYGIARGMQVEGWDINPNCVEGSKRNLEFAFGAESVANWRVVHHDSSQIVPDATIRDSATSHLSHFDCVVSNMPWGINTVSDAYDNQRILTSLRHGLRVNTPVILVSKVPMNHELEELGFQIIGQANVPQQNFTLPNKKHLRKREEMSGEPKGRSDCVVTVAIST